MNHCNSEAQSFPGMVTSVVSGSRCVPRFNPTSPQSSAPGHARISLVLLWSNTIFRSRTVITSARLHGAVLLDVMSSFRGSVRSAIEFTPIDPFSDRVLMRFFLCAAGTLNKDGCTKPNVNYERSYLVFLSNFSYLQHITKSLYDGP